MVLFLYIIYNDIAINSRSLDIKLKGVLINEENYQFQNKYD